MKLQWQVTAYPTRLKSLVIGAGTYPAFEVLDKLIAAGVPEDRLHVHLGHTCETGGKRNPFARYHPMLHSKVYYMEMAGANACAFIGSHNVTAFALGGLNGEAGVMLEGPAESPEFKKIRRHIEEAENQAVSYSPTLKEAFAWWSREFIDGLRTEIGMPQDWTTVRTILIFASAEKADRPSAGDHIYFEIAEGIEQIESLKTEVHLFLFSTLPSDPRQALTLALSSDARFTCRTLGAENRQGNLEVIANWRIEGMPMPVLTRVPSGRYRPNPPKGMQQVRAEVQTSNVQSFEYLFERERVGWDPQFSYHEHPIKFEDHSYTATNAKSQGSEVLARPWRLVTGLLPRSGPAREADEVALKRAAPESGAFILVSLRRRAKEKQEVLAAAGLNDSQLTESGLHFELHRAQVADRRVPAPNKVWAMDFVHDQLFDGRKIRILTISRRRSMPEGEARHLLERAHG